jgi:cell fate regulator YaaT (PSP1 superfamily)
MEYMKKVVGVRFKSAGKVYDFDSGAFVLNRGDHVIVETEQGLGLGVVVIPPAPNDESAARQSAKPLKKVFRLANPDDFSQREKNIETERNAHAYCMNCIRELGLKMNLFSVESSFDGSKLTFFFTSEGRVDFRQLVKMLVKEFGVRVEMRQVGIRNQAKMCGGLGRCGREICCSAFIEKFGPVSIRMAKEQGLSLNPTKISGQCGRLMCCLTFEHDMYHEIQENFPKIGAQVTIKAGKGKVIRYNALYNRIVVRLEGGEEIETRINEIIRN